MRPVHVGIPLLVVGLIVAGTASIGQRPGASGGFDELQRASVPGAQDVEVVMGLIERDGESTSGKHLHPGGEFGFVVVGSVMVTTEGGATKTLGAGESFHQPPGAWHIISTGTDGAKTVVFRLLEEGQPMVVPVE